MGSTRIEKRFERLREQGERALVTFITAGDPDIETTKEIIFTIEKAGADIIELGIPFSDPMADGPTIQAASERALLNKVNLKQILKLVKECRKVSQIPIILFGYYNPIFAHGAERFALDAGKAGVDGVLVVDLPPEEAGELKKHTDRAGLDLICLITPTCDDKRIKLITDIASGFIYYVSLTGVTGARSELSNTIPGFVKKTKRHTDLPVCVGFGISTPEQAATVARHADGVVVGSALIKVIEANLRSKHLLKKVGSFVAVMKKGLE
jgi:tryptophan synthase alpha chain